jgi:hypothetical protein
MLAKAVCSHQLECVSVSRTGTTSARTCAVNVLVEVAGCRTAVMAA